MALNSVSQIKAVLENLNSKSSSIEASAVMTRDGHTIESLLSPGVDPVRLSAMAASLLSLAETTARELDRGELTQVLVHGSNGFVLMVQAGSKGVLSVVSRTDSKLGMLLVEAKRAAATVSEFL